MSSKQSPGTPGSTARRRSILSHGSALAVLIMGLGLSLIAQTVFESMEITMAVVFGFSIAAALLFWRAEADGREAEDQISCYGAGERAQQPVANRVEPKVRPAGEFPAPPSPSKTKNSR